MTNTLPKRRYRVTQIGTTTTVWGDTYVDELGTKDYRWLWMARIKAWMVKGESILGVTKYTSTLEDLHYNTNAI